MSNASKKSAPAPIVYTRRSTKALALAFFATFALFGLDYWSKQWAVRTLAREQIPAPTNVCQPASWGGVHHARVPARDIPVIEGFFEMSYAENCGAAFGLLNDSTSIGKKILFLGAAICVSILLAYMLYSGRGGPLFIYAVPLVVSGALGNFTDRVQFGYVVDFIHVFYRDWSYPTFNVADAWIAIGTVLLVIDGFLEAKAERKALEQQAKLEQQKSEPEKQPEATTNERADEAASVEV